MNDIAFIQLTNGGFCVVDADLFDTLNKRKWRRDREGYIVSGSTHNKIVWMHRLVNRTLKGMMTDHKNGVRFDNRRCNLRTANDFTNQFNKLKTKNPKTSRFKGVCFRKDRGTWIASICANKKSRKIGTFTSEEDAARAYDAEAMRIFGEFANPNFRPQLPGIK